MTDNRLMEISSLLAHYSMGDFDYEVELSENLDEIDTIISSVNMLGEELRETTISRDFFSSIYDTVADMLFVVTNEGIIRDTNTASKTKIKSKKLLEGSFEDLRCHEDEQISFESIKEAITPLNATYHFEVKFTFGKEPIYASCSATTIKNAGVDEYLIVAEDITLKKESEAKILRAVLETQENERKRVADDLHDSLGQELSTVKMMLGVARRTTQDKAQLEIVTSTLDILEKSIQELRNTCFNLMPSILEKGGLIFALYQLLETMPLEIELNTNVSELNISKNQEVSIYRVIQEFINNSIKHAEASKIEIIVEQSKQQLDITVSDNGKGFDMETSRDHHDGRGLNTMKSRIESFGGKYILTSKPGQGVKLNITFL